MALTIERKRLAARRFVHSVFKADASVTASVSTDDIDAAINSLDTALATVINDVPAAWGTKTIMRALIDNLPEPFQTESTAAQKAAVLSAWAFAEAGLS